MGNATGIKKAHIKLKEKLGSDAHKIVGSKGGLVKSDAKKQAAKLREQRKREKRSGLQDI